MFYFIFFLVAFILTIIFVKIFRFLAIKYQVVDDPRLDPQRKIHQKPIPLLGGPPLFFGFFISLFLLFVFNQWPVGQISIKNLIGVLIASALLVISGVLDEKKNLKPVWQLIPSLFAILIVIGSGIGIKYINNPFGDGLIFLEQNKIEITRLNSVPYYLSWPADLITFIWLLVVIYAIKLLAGLDGLVPGIVSVGSLIIFCFCVFTAFVQPQVASLAIILTGVSLGFLIFNFHPAKIFLGTSGEMFLGLMLGVLAVISGSKIAILLLILGIPILDLIWIVFRRVFKEKRSPFRADRKHLHFRLLDFGFSHQGAVIFLWSISLIFGLIGLLFPTTKIKVLALGLLILVMVVLAIIITRQQKIDKKKENGKLSSTFIR